MAYAGGPPERSDVLGPIVRCLKASESVMTCRVAGRAERSRACHGPLRAAIAGQDAPRHRKHGAPTRSAVKLEKLGKLAKSLSPI